MQTIRWLGVIAFCSIILHPTWARIYTCVDASGRKLTSDQPIPECKDRPQEQRGRSGVVQKVLTPSQTLEEQQRTQEQKQQQEQETLRKNEQLQRDRALLTRYPTRAHHDQARHDALTQIDKVIQSVKDRLALLEKQKREFQQNQQTYKNQGIPTPGWLKRKIDDNAAELISQQHYLEQQYTERKRIDTKFEQEFQKLLALW